MLEEQKCLEWIWFSAEDFRKILGSKKIRARGKLDMILVLNNVPNLVSPRITLNLLKYYLKKGWEILIRMSPIKKYDVCAAACRGSIHSRVYFVPIVSLDVSPILITILQCVGIHKIVNNNNNNYLTTRCDHYRKFWTQRKILDF